MSFGTLVSIMALGTTFKATEMNKNRIVNFIMLNTSISSVFITIRILSSDHICDRNVTHSEQSGFDQNVERIVNVILTLFLPMDVVVVFVAERLFRRN